MVGQTRQCRLPAVYGRPNSTGGQRHLQLLGLVALACQRIGDGIEDGWCRTNGAQLANAFHAEYVGFARYGLVQMGVEIDLRHVGMGQGVVH